jgi:hypothetical protein
MPRPASIFAATALLILLGCGNEPAPPKAEEPAPPKAEEPAPTKAGYQQQADRAEWNWRPEQANLLYCVRRNFRDYQAEIICPKETRDGFEENPLTIRLTDGGKEVYSFKANDETVFTRRGDVLYIADFSPRTTGCSVVAFDFKAKKELWKTKLKGIRVRLHSEYENQVTIEMTTSGAILVNGKESFGRYIEYVDMKSGKTVGHKVFK